MAATIRASRRSERLHAVAASSDSAQSVRFLGERADVPDLVAAFDVAALSSDFEGSPLSVMEYMEAGKPVVATRVGGLPDLVEDGVTACWSIRRTRRARGAPWSRFCSDPERAARMGEAGRRRRREEFSIEATARQVGDLYEELYAAKAGGWASRRRR